MYTDNTHAHTYTEALALADKHSAPQFVLASLSVHTHGETTQTVI